MRDGRVVFIGSQRIDDVTAHSAFAGGAKAVADFYDQKASAEHATDLTYKENGATHSIWWKRPTTRGRSVPSHARQQGPGGYDLRLLRPLA